MKNVARTSLWLVGAALAGFYPVAAYADVYEIGSSGGWVSLTPPVAPMAPAPVAAATKPTPYQAEIAIIAGQFGLSPALVDAVAWAESRHRADAVSPAGAIGVMQLMPATARSLGVRDARDPVQNIRGGAAYLRAQLDRFDNDLERALAAYNAGPGAVLRHGRVPPYRETQKYVRDILDRLASGLFAANGAY